MPEKTVAELKEGKAALAQTIYDLVTQLESEYDLQVKSVEIVTRDGRRQVVINSSP